MSETERKELVRVPVADLLRVAPFKAHDDMRYYLNGILVTPCEDHALLVATNGHWIAVYESRESWTDKERILDLPWWFLRQVEQLHKDRRLTDARDAEWLDADEDAPAPSHKPKDLVVIDEQSRLTIREPGNEVLVKPGLPFIDGKYPDWRKVLPDPSTLESGLITPFAVNYFARLGEAVPTDRGHGIRFFQCREGGGSNQPGVFRYESLPGFVVALMPMRDEKKLGAWPEWMKKEEKTEAAA